MSEATFAEWTIVTLLFVLMCAYWFFFGDLAAQVLLRRTARGEDTSFRKWGVEEELFRPRSLNRLAGWGVFVVISMAFTFMLAFQSTVLVTDDWTTASDRLQYTLAFAVYALLIGYTFESGRIKRITDMTRKLDNLKDSFHRRLSASELLSMYEALRPAPSLFWDEYASLPDEEIGYDTNRSYRERAAPFGRNQSSRYNRITMAVAGLTLVLTAVLVAKELLT